MVYEFDRRIRKGDNTNLIVAEDNTNELIRSTKNVFADTIHDAPISTAAGTEIDQIKLVVPISTIMRLITQRDGDLSPYFVVIDESQNSINH